VNDKNRPAVRPADERLRACGQDLVMRLLALVRVGRSYQVENQVFRQQLRTFVGALQPVFAESHEAIFVSFDGDLYLNGVRLPVKTTNLRFHQALMQEFARRRIAGVRVLEGVEEPDLERFFRFFLQPDAYAGPALLEACVAEGTPRVLPAIHVPTQADEQADPLDPASYTRWAKDATPAGADGGGGGSGDGGGDGPDPRAAATPPAGLRPGARKDYSLAVLGARSVLTTTVLQAGVPLSRAKRVVQPLIDGAFAGEPVVLGLSTLSHHDEYTYAHSVNVCMVAVTIGHVLGLDRRALADLGVAALLHDTGKAAVYDRIRHPLGEFDEEERRLAESHPLEGAKLIARSTALNGSTLRCMRVALEHHAAGPGPGFPALPGGWRASRLSGIVAIADCFVSLQTHRSERGRAVTPYEALGMVLGPLAGRFEPALSWALVRSVGFYPAGQLVELSDGRTALVLAPDPDDPARPHVRVVLDECGVPFSALEGRELRPLPAALHVKRALPAAEYPDLPAAA
jgi:HD-GYP domain-containing protein (c-di-GMP phosphodiesterase class II)